VSEEADNRIRPKEVFVKKIVLLLSVIAVAIGAKKLLGGNDDQHSAA
jgi:hypothetical protein